MSSIVRLMRGLSSQLSDRRPVERDSDKTFGFSARFWGFNKRLSISDKSGSGRHQWVD